MFPFSQAGGVQPLDDVDPVKVSVSGDDAGYTETTHDSRMNEVPGFNAGIPIHQFSGEDSVFCVDGFYATLHCLSELSKNNPPL